MKCLLMLFSLFLCFDVYSLECDKEKISIKSNYIIREVDLFNQYSGEEISRLIISYDNGDVAIVDHTACVVSIFVVDYYMNDSDFNTAANNYFEIFDQIISAQGLKTTLNIYDDIFSGIKTGVFSESINIGSSSESVAFNFRIKKNPIGTGIYSYNFNSYIGVGGIP